MEKDKPNLNQEGPTPGPETGPRGGDGRRDAEDVSSQPTSGELEELRKRAEERDAYRTELLRAKADLDNFQKRVRRERPGWEDQAVRRFLRDLLPVADNLERALAHSGAGASGTLDAGVRMTLQMLEQVLRDHGVEEIPARGETFNPEIHEAVAEVEVAHLPTGAVAEVLEKGYKHRDAVLRPSRVNVARNAGAEAARRENP